MTTRWFGAPVQRVEDDRLLRGHGRFTDDIDEGALECCFVRSPHAHARIKSIDASAARGMPGVVRAGAKLALFGVAPTPVLADPRDPARGLLPSGDLEATPEFRMHLVRVLTERAFAA